MAGHGEGEVWGLDRHPSQPRFITASYDGTVRIWDIANKVCVADSWLVAGYREGEFWGLDRHPSQPRFITASYDGTVRIWDIANKVCVAGLIYSCWTFMPHPHPPPPIERW